MKASPAVYLMMQDKVKINESPRKKERLIEVDEENPDIELLKEVVDAETESKEIETLRLKYEEETEDIKELYEPDLTSKDEMINEQDVGMIMSQEMIEDEGKEFRRMLINLSEMEIERTGDEEINVGKPSDVEGDKENGQET
jgi:hypothetical protein